MAIFASSDFNGTSGQSLPAFDANWIGWGGDNVPVISNAGRCRPLGDRSLNRSRYSVTPASADYDVTCDVFIKAIGPTTNPNFAGPALRGEATAGNMYTLELVGVPNILRIRRLLGGVFTTLTSVAQTIADETNYNLKFRAVGTSLTGYVNGSLRISVTSGSVTDAGQPAIIQQNNTPDDNNGYHIDNWVAETNGDNVITPTGGITFSGTGSITTFRDPNHTIPVSGGIVFSGTGNQSNLSAPPHVITPTGGIVFSGTGDILFEKSPPHIIPVSGGIVFSGTAPMLFNYEPPVGGPRMPLTGVGL